MLVLYLIILILTLILTKAKYKTLIKSNVLFTGMWCICSGISSLGLYGLYKPSLVVHLYSITAIFVFNLVFFIHNKTNLSRNTIQLVGEARLLIIYFANIIAWIYLSQFIPKAINIIKAFGLRGLRPYAFDSSLGFGTTKQLLIVQWIVYSIFVATVLIAMIYSVMRKKHLLLNIFAVIDVALYTFLFGGRYLIVRMLMFYLFAFLIVKSLELEKLKVKNLNFVLIGILIIMTIILTNLRNWGNTSFIENVVIYYTGSFTFLDVILSEFDWTTSPLFGTGMFGFIINFIHALFALIFEVPYNSSSCQVITHFTGIPRFISPTVKYNAMTTMLYPFIRDFGFVGIIMGTSFLAWFISFVENKFKKSNSLLYLCLYVYLAFVLFDSVMSYQLLFPASGVTMGLLFIFIKSVKKGR